MLVLEVVEAVGAGSQADKRLVFELPERIPGFRGNGDAGAEHRPEFTRR